MYHTHDFSASRVIASAELDEMEAQMQENLSRILTQQTRAAALDAASTERIRALRLTESGGYLVLSCGDTVLSAAAIEPDLALYVPPTAIGDIPASMLLNKGESQQLSPSITPADHSCILRFVSGDRRIVRVDRSGLAKAEGVGKTKLYVRVGELEAQVNVQVNEVIYPAVLTRGLQMGWRSEENAFQFYYSQKSNGLILPESGFVCPPACTAKIDMGGDTWTAQDHPYGIWDWHVLRPTNGETPVSTWDALHTSQFVYSCEIVTETANHSGEDMRRAFSYHNTSDTPVWICLRVTKDFHEFTDADAAAVQALLKCTILPD